jgi:hypothetical protein
LGSVGLFTFVHQKHEFGFSDADRISVFDEFAFRRFATTSSCGLTPRHKGVPGLSGKNNFGSGNTSGNTALQLVDSKVMAVEAVLSEPLSQPDSLLSGINTGILRGFCRKCPGIIQSILHEFRAIYRAFL